jgi:hypothetical protein
VAGDAFEVPPGHDAWVIGDEPHVSIDWAGRRLFAKSPHEISDRIFTTAVFTDLCGSTEMHPARRRPVAPHSRGTQ